MDIKADKDTAKIIVFVILGILGVVFLVKFGGTILKAFKNILSSFGLINDADDDAVDDLFESGVPVGSPWNGETWLTRPIQPSWTDVFVGVGVPGANNVGVRKAPFAIQTLLIVEQKISETRGFWVNDVETLMGILKGTFRTQAEFSFYVWHLAKYKNIDALEWYQEDKPFEEGFSNETIVKINNWLKSLKKY